MADDVTPALSRRELGAALRRLRVERGWTIEFVAQSVGASLSKISRMETCARGVSARDLAALTALFRVGGDERRRLLLLAADGKKRATTLPPELLETDFARIEQRSFVELERVSVGIREYNSSTIPGLLQCESYMRASMAGSAPDALSEAVDSAVEVRLARQRVMRRSEAPEFEAIIDESALHRLVGGCDVMVEQLESLRRAVSERNLSLFVIPFNAGAHPGLNSSFVALMMPAPAVPDVVFVEGLAGHTRFDAEDTVGRYRRVWDALMSTSTSREGTVKLLDARLQALASRAASSP